MNYEKKYKSALEWIRSIYPTMQGADKEDAEHYFPELKESEDERIRKGLIKGLSAMRDIHKHQTFSDDAINIDDAIAWLEKQGYDGKKWIYEDEYIKDKKQTFQDGMDEVLGNPQKYGLEKQCEQNTIVNESPSKEMILAVWELGNIWKELTKGSSCTEHGTQLQYIQKHWNESDYYEKLQGEQKPTDEIKPKFKVGDWITNGVCIIQITSVDDRYYWHDNDCVGGDIESIDKEYHLWAIQDAKEGDVLVNDDDLFVFDGTLEEKRFPFAYCGIINGDFGIYSRNLPFTHHGNIYPATKEQHDILFRKMKEEGYEWDAEKKELKKIEVLLSLDEAIEHCREMSCGNNARALEHKQLEKWLTELKELKEQKPFLSEEDESFIEDITNVIIENYSILQSDKEKMIDWLKSINRWKPSDEQMEAFAIAVHDAHEHSYYNNLFSLYNDLKKFKSC